MGTKEERGKILDDLKHVPAEIFLDMLIHHETNITFNATPKDILTEAARRSAGGR